MIRDPKVSRVIYGVITNDVSDYVNLLVRIAHIICNHLILLVDTYLDNPTR